MQRRRIRCPTAAVGILDDATSFTGCADTGKARRENASFLPAARARPGSTNDGRTPGGVLTARWRQRRHGGSGVSRPDRTPESPIFSGPASHPDAAERRRSLGKGDFSWVPLLPSRRAFLRFRKAGRSFVQRRSEIPRESLPRHAERCFFFPARPRRFFSSFTFFFFLFFFFPSDKSRLPTSLSSFCFVFMLAFISSAAS